MKTFPVPGFAVPALAKADLCVVGGGTVGLAAAVGAARCGGHAAGERGGLVVRDGRATQDLSGREVREWMHDHELKTADQS